MSGHPTGLTHYVYVARDGECQALYVGQTYNLTRRMRAHRGRSVWFADAAEIIVAGPYTSRDARRYETDLIWTLGPVYNRPQAVDYYDFGLDFDGVTPVERIPARRATLRSLPFEPFTPGVCPKAPSAVSLDRSIELAA